MLIIIFILCVCGTMLQMTGVSNFHSRLLIAAISQANPTEATADIPMTFATASSSTYSTGTSAQL